MSAAIELSGIRKKSLATLIRESVPDQQIIAGARRRELGAWFRQSERLAMARRDHRLRGEKFRAFARRLGIDKSSAYMLVHLCRYRAEITGRCLDMAEDAAKRGEVYRPPGWETALGWFHNAGKTTRGNFLLTPPRLYAELDREFHFDFDPCPNPRPDGFNSLVIPWGRVNYVNPPYRGDDVHGGRSMMDFVKKAIAEQQIGNTSVLLVPGYAFLEPLLRAGAEIRPAGRVAFADPDTGETPSHPISCILCVLRPKPAPGWAVVRRIVQRYAAPPAE